MQKEKSCGIAVLKDNGVLLVHHNIGHWGLPKGHVEENETEEETAIREVIEETNIEAKIIPGFRKVITYSPREGVMKDVVFFTGIPETDELKNQECEVSEVKYVDIDEALNLVSHEDEKDVIKEAISFYNNK